MSFTADNSATLSAATGVTGTDGSVNVNVTSTTAGDSTVTATLAGGSTATTTVTFTVDSSNLSTTRSSLTASPPYIRGNGSDLSAITLTLRDAQGNAVSGLRVTFSTTLANSSVGTVMDNRDGSYTAYLSGTTLGTTTVTANVNGVAFGVSPVQVTLTTDYVGYTIVGVPVVDRAPADGVSRGMVRWTVKDRNGQLAANVPIVLNASPECALVDTEIITGSDGTADSFLTCTRPFFGFIQGGIPGVWGNAQFITFY
ncbi:Ig-like domain-containing protein [Citrobacter werkmanii]